MKRFEIINMYRILGKIKLNKIEDRELRNAIISNHLKMFRIANENDAYVISLREQFDPEATKELNEAYQAYADEQVELDLIKVDRDKLSDAIAKGGIDFTLAEFVFLEPMFKD